ncbi:C-type lectin domain family 18 member B-like [Amphiura filiformis]|uniref:C-type lectin domain family 18 member B-like n=1 Tax=Amphiura filiformis TaxID=82378 RepID=UPI003B21640C
MAAKRAFFIITFLCIQVFHVYSQSAKPAATEDTTNEENREPKHDTAKKSFFDVLRGAISNFNAQKLMNFSTDEADDIVKIHNHYRSNTDPPAANMKHMSWDANLASMAQNFTDKCNLAGGFGPNLTPYRVGRNAYILQNCARANLKSGVSATEFWHDQAQFYTYDNNSCTPGEHCVHYKQVVWADTSFVGCGRTFCSQLLVSGQWWNKTILIVCAYGPGGNSELPFIKGERCSQCPNDAGFCTAEGLCRDCRDQGNEVENCGVCNKQCKNCGILDEETCTCKCAPGWDGADCSEPCSNHHEWCGANPGWPSAKYCDIEPYDSYTKRYCRQMCGSCQPADANFQCNRRLSSAITTVNVTSRIIKSTKYCKTSFTYRWQ